MKKLFAIFFAFAFFASYSPSAFAAPQDVPDGGATSDATGIAEGAAWSGTGVGVYTIDDAAIGATTGVSLDPFADNTGTATINASTTFAGSVGVSAADDLGDVNVGGTGAFTVTFLDVFAVNLDIQNASTANFTGDFTGTAIDFESAGIVNLATGSDITGSVTNTSGAAAGTLTFAGTSSVSGAIGSAGTGALSVINAGATGGVVTLGGDAFATTFNITGTGTVNADSITGAVEFDGGGTLSIDTGEDITGAVTNTTGAAAGTLTLEGTNTVTGAIGAAGVGALSTINAGADGGVVTLGGDAFATTTNITGTGTVNADSITGAVVFVGNGILSIDPSEVITGAVTNTTDGFGTLTFEGTTATGGAIGVAGAGDLLAVNFNGGIATLNNDIAAITTTVNADTDLVLSADRTMTGNLTLAGTSDLELANNTLTLGGTGIYTQGAGTSINLTVNSAADFGNVQATGNSAIAAGSLVGVNVLGPVASGTTLNIVNGAAAGAVGDVTVTDNSLFLSFTDSAVAGDLILTATLNASGVATTPNALAVLMAIDGALATGATADFLTVINALFQITDPAEATAALEQLDPIIDGGILGANYAIGAHFMNALISHLNALHGGYLFSQSGPMRKTMQTGVASGDGVGNENWWAQGFGSTIEQDARNGINGYDADVYGTAIGADGRIGERIRLGWAGGYANGDVDSQAENGQTDIDSYQGALYGSYSDGPGYINAAFMFAWNEYDGSRDIRFGTINRTATADYSGQQYNALIDGGYTIKAGPWDITPVASLNYIHLDIEDYTEEGANSLNLNVSDQDYDLLQSGLGVKLAYPLFWDAGTFVPEVHAKWLYDFIGDEMQTSSIFTGGGPAFTTTGAEPEQHSLNAGASITFYSKGNVSVSANYDAEIKDDFTSHSGFGTVRIHF